MNDTPDTIELDILIRRVTKMWNQANHPGTPQAEREVFEAKALSLMDQHRITSAMLDLGHDDPLGDVFFGVVAGRYAPAVSMILENVSNAYGVKVWWRTVSSSPDRKMSVFGFKSDCDRTISLAKMLMADATTQAAKHKGYDMGDTMRYRRDFLMGYAAAVGARLRESLAVAMQDMHLDVKSTDLVLVARKVQVDGEFSKRKMRTSSYRPNMGRGYGAGAEAGRNASLGISKGVSSTRKALGS